MSGDNEMTPANEATHAAPEPVVMAAGGPTGPVEPSRPGSPCHALRRRGASEGGATEFGLRADLARVAAAARSGRPSPLRLRDYFRQVAATPLLSAMLAEAPCPRTLRQRSCSDLADILRTGLHTGAFRVRDIDASVNFAFDVLRAICGDRRFPCPGSRLACSGRDKRDPDTVLDDHVGLLLRAWGNVGA